MVYYKNHNLTNEHDLIFRKQRLEVPSNNAANEMLGITLKELNVQK